MKKSRLGFQFWFVCLSCVLILTGQLMADELLGAKKVLAEIEHLLAAAATVPKTAAIQSQGQILLAAIRQFVGRQKDIAPEAAADEWLKLLDRYLAVPDADKKEWDYYGSNTDIFTMLTEHTMLAAIPGPDSWPLLAAKVARRPKPAAGLEMQERGLRLLAALLTQQTTLADNELQALLNDAASEQSPATALVKENVKKLQQLLRQLTVKEKSEKVDWQINDFQNQLEQPLNWRSSRIFKIPDLVALTGREKAAELLTSALLAPNLYLQIPQGRETLELARAIAQKNLARLSVPQWGLVQSLSTTGLFESMRTIFQKKQAENKEFEQPWEIERLQGTASVYYLFGLLSQGKIDQAAQAALGLKESDLDNVKKIWGKIDRSRSGLSYLEFFRRVLSSAPQLPLWDLYLELARSLQRGKEPLQMLQTLLRNQELPLSKRQVLQTQLIAAYLQLDQPKPAATAIRTLLRLDGRREKAETMAGLLDTQMRMALKLAKLGDLLQNPSWVKEAIAAAAKIQKELRGQLPQQDSNSDFFEYLLQKKLYGEAEALIMADIETRLKKDRPTRENEPSFRESFVIQPELINLAMLYNSAGRYQDTLLLLEGSPYWGAADILYNVDTLKLTAAEALHACGRDQEALAIVKNYLYVNNDDDAAYRLLLSINDENHLSWLDELYARDRFEERPLIWKAWLLKKNNRLDEAEKTVREALQVDPTDGEQRKGDRVRGYEVLAEILVAKGKHEDAAFFRNVVQAVRLAETGDDYTDAGLIGRSLDCYEKAQVFFADAYCVQWRLAERLYISGDIEGAKKHYQIAFERMPEQFGQMASFCFGCENAFGRPESRSVAEKVLLRLAAEQQPRPQVYYLLSELRQNQERYTEAYDFLKQAVALDPDYLDAWKKLFGLSESLFIVPNERDVVSLRLLQLDPLQKHFYGPVVMNGLGAWPKLWQIIAVNQKFALARPQALFSLLASQQRLAEQKKQSNYHYFQWHTVPLPGEVLAQQPIMQAIAHFFKPGRGSFNLDGIE